MLAIIEKGFDLLCREMGAYLGITQNGLLQSTTGGMGVHRGFVYQSVGALFADTFSERKHHSFGEHESSCCLKVSPHAIRMDYKISRECALQVLHFLAYFIASRSNECEQVKPLSNAIACIRP